MSLVYIIFYLTDTYQLRYVHGQLYEYTTVVFHSFRQFLWTSSFSLSLGFLFISSFSSLMHFHWRSTFYEQHMSTCALYRIGTAYSSGACCSIFTFQICNFLADIRVFSSIFFLIIDPGNILKELSCKQFKNFSLVKKKKSMSTATSDWL